MSGLLMSHREKISYMYHVQTVVLKAVLCRVVVSIYAMKMLAKESNCCLSAHCSSMVLQVVLSAEVEEIFFNY